MMTDIEIAQSVKPKHIMEIAKAAGVDEKYVELYGNAKAKLEPCFNSIVDRIINNEIILFINWFNLFQTSKSASHSSSKNN